MATISKTVFVAAHQYSAMSRMTTRVQTGRFQFLATPTEFPVQSKNNGIVCKTRICVEVTRCSTKDDGHVPHENLASLELQMALAREELQGLVPDDAGLSIINALEKENNAAGKVGETKLEIKEFLRMYETKNKEDWPLQFLDLAYYCLVKYEELHFFEIIHLQEVAAKHSGLGKIMDVVRKMKEVQNSIIEYHKEKHSSIVKNN